MGSKKYDRDSKVTHIIRLLAEAFKESNPLFETSELHKRFEEERESSNSAKYAMEYISFLRRNDDQGLIY